MKKYCFIVVLFFVAFVSRAQSLPIGQVGTEDMLRALQLEGKIDESYSFTARPFIYQKNLDRKDLWNLIDSTHKIKLAEKHFANDRVSIGLMPAIFSSKFNSHHPYGWNDQGMIKAKGLETAFTAGVYAKIGPLSIQLQPEFVSVANNAYDITAGYGSNSGKSFSKLYAGQSAVRLNLGAVSIAASTENLWWGPGQFSSLLMSNNAPGFEHLSLHTNRPLKTPIGSFEFQLVGGKFEEDSSAANENNFMRPINSAKKEWRYFNGMVLTFQPKGMKGFFLGLIRQDHIYNSEVANRGTSFFKKWLPVLAWNSATDNADPTLNSANSDGYVSLFTRWILPKHQAEFYVEYGYNDFKQNLRDFSTNPNHSSAFIAGFKKVVTLQNNELLDVSGEITQMAQTTSYIVRSAGNWYVHGLVTQGLTNQNKILGAGSGEGNNVQTIQVKKINGFNYLGIKFQRIQEDPKGLAGGRDLIGMREIQWNDLSLGLLGQKRWGKFLLNGEMQFVSSKNYGWEKGDRFNLYALLNCVYFF